MLGWRLTISAVLVPTLLALFWWDSQQGTTAPVLLTLCLLLTVRAAYEAVGMLRTRAMQPRLAVVAIVNIVVVLAAWGHTRLPGTPAGNLGLLTSLGIICGALAAGFLVLLLVEAVQYREPGHSMESLGANSVCVLYSGVLLAVTAQLRWLPTPEIGYFALGSVIITAKAGDIMAYTFGRLWGKRKMVPTLSPGKTWMGGFGAIVGSCLGGWLWFTFGGGLFDAQPISHGLVVVLAFSATMGVVGLIGDLCESLFKRDTQNKDSAALMPGFGGLLDLLDSPLYAGPIAVAWWALWPPAGL